MGYSEPLVNLKEIKKHKGKILRVLAKKQLRFEFLEKSF